MHSGNRDDGVRLDRKRSNLKKAKHLLFGKPRDLSDSSIFHHLSLIAFLAWVGLGADGLSSSAYGPEEAFRALGQDKYLALLLALLMAATVFIISACYKRIISAFPQGGGGYVVASKLLGQKVGLVSGCALLVDYVLTITISVAAAGDALFSFMPLSFHGLKLATEIVIVFLLITLNLRGVKESVMVLVPIFIIFVATHFAAIVYGICAHLPEVSQTATTIRDGFHTGLQTQGALAMLLIFMHAYSLGGGTYTGIEAVSNGLPIMREPRVQTARKTMTYMALSLAFTASGLLLCYLLWGIEPEIGKTMNAVLLEKMTRGIPGASSFVVVTLFAEGFLLIVAAQAGFIDGPRVLANMAVDSWVPRRFAALSDRLTTANGIILMGVTSLIALWFTHGSVSHLVVMYSINVFLTFSLSIIGMLLWYLRSRRQEQNWGSSVLLFAVGSLLCVTILIVTICEKFMEGGWITLSITGGLVILFLITKSHYLKVAKQLSQLYSNVRQVSKLTPSVKLPLDNSGRTAVILVGGYTGLGIHTVTSILRMFPGVYRNFIFVSVGVVDSGGFKGESALESLRLATTQMLEKYVTLANGLGMAADYRFAIGTDIAEEGTVLCRAVAEEFSEVTFFTGKVVFQNEGIFQRLLHNETGFTLQKRLQEFGLTMVILPASIA